MLNSRPLRRSVVGPLAISLFALAATMAEAQTGATGPVPDAPPTGQSPVPPPSVAGTGADASQPAPAVPTDTPIVPAGPAPEAPPRPEDRGPPPVTGTGTDATQPAPATSPAPEVRPAEPGQDARPAGETGAPEPPIGNGTAADRPGPPAAAAVKPRRTGPIVEARTPRDDRLPAPVNIYAGTTAGHLSPAVSGALDRVYVPNVGSGDVHVIDPATLKVVDHFRVGQNPQHIVPSWDLKTLWVTGSARSHSIHGSLTAIDPMTGKPSVPLPMEDAYNMYFTPDGASAIIVAESRHRLEYRDPHTMKLQGSLTIPNCAGINHADFSSDGRYAIFTCEFTGALVKVDVAARTVLGFLKLSKGGMPQDIRSSPDGELFFVANMMTDGVAVVEGASFKEIGFIPTGIGAHGLYPSRDGTKLYVSNRGSRVVSGSPHGRGSVSVIDFATRKVEVTWPIPGGGSPDMGNVSADGRRLWLSGRFDNVVYAIDTTTGHVDSIRVGRTPHGIAVWPQPGRYSLGHTGVMR